MKNRIILSICIYLVIVGSLPAADTPTEGNSSILDGFLAQFDEMDEGTKYFKCVREVPVGPSHFIGYEEEIQSDHYLWLAGKAGEMLRAEIAFSTRMPERVIPGKT